MWLIDVARKRDRGGIQIVKLVQWTRVVDVARKREEGKDSEAGQWARAILSSEIVMSAKDSSCCTCTML